MSGRDPWRCRLFGHNMVVGTLDWPIPGWRTGIGLERWHCVRCAIIKLKIVRVGTPENPIEGPDDR